MRSRRTYQSDLDDPAARENEAEMLLQNGLLDRYLDSFARLVAARPLSDRIKQLIGLYRLHGRIDDELATLRAYAGTSMLGLAEIQRLGAILAERGDWLEAERWAGPSGLDSATRRERRSSPLAGCPDRKQPYR